MGSISEWRVLGSEARIAAISAAKRGNVRRARLVWRRGMMTHSQTYQPKHRMRYAATLQQALPLHVRGTSYAQSLCRSAQRHQAHAHHQDARSAVDWGLAWLCAMRCFSSCWRLKTLGARQSWSTPSRCEAGSGNQGRARKRIWVDIKALRRRDFENGWQPKAATGEDAAAVVTLSPLHNDPFDQKLAARAGTEGVFISDC